MRLPSDAQAALLSLVASIDGEVEWLIDDPQYDSAPSRADLVVEKIDREANTATFEPVDPRGRKSCHRVVTIQASERRGWLRLLHDRKLTIGGQRWSREVALRQLDLTEDGVIALGLWRERKLNAPPEPEPVPTAHEMELIQLAQRALDLGYALAPRKPARAEAKRMRQAGWFDRRGIWIANAAAGMVPTATAIVAVFPDRADVTPSPRETRRG